MPFKSLQPDIDLPQDITIWNWLFDSKASPLARFPENEVKGFTNCLTNERVSFHDIKEYSTYISTALVFYYGFKVGDTVALFSPNNVWYPVAMYSALRIGGVVSGASPAYNVEEMTYALKTGKAKFLMTVPSSMKVAAAAAHAAGIPREKIILLEGSKEGYTTIRDLILLGKSFRKTGQAQPFTFLPGEKNGDVCAFLSFSSGTTGLPKAVMISHQNVIAQCLQMQPLVSPTHRKVLAVLPSFHITGLVHVLHLPLVMNSEVYMLPAYSMEAMLDVITTYGIEELLLVPPIIIRMVRDHVVDKYDLSCVKMFNSGAAPLSEEILQQLKAKFPWTGLKQGYGMTESSSCITAHTPEHIGFDYAHAVGAICASTEVMIVDEEGRELGVGMPGELLARGPQITMGYLNNAKATRETYLPNGFLRTGDQAMISQEGLVTITDRIKEMIKVKGIAVAPAEIEDLLLGHQYVEDCAVLGIPDEYSGEKPKAFVVAKLGAPTSQELGKLLLDYVKERKVRYKWLKEVEFTDIIPKSASGKILRRVLKNQSAKGTIVNDGAAERARM